MLLELLGENKVDELDSYFKIDIGFPMTHDFLRGILDYFILNLGEEVIQILLTLLDVS